MASQHPIQVHPANPHCFQFRESGFKIVTSAEHYGALINGAFDYVAYIDELARAGMNATRLFTFYRELPHNIPEPGRMNTLAPALEDAILPWERVTGAVNGHGLAADGGNKFDLMRWSRVYFERLHDIVARCSRAGIVCEITLFCNPYDRERYDLFPCSAASNINGVGEGLDEPWQFMTLEVPSLVIWQEQFINKMLRELAPYDNVYFEICNESMIYGDPSAAGAQRVIRWQLHMAQILSRLEGGAHDPVHLVALNAHYRIGGADGAEAGSPAVAVIRHDDMPYAASQDVDIINYHYLSTKVTAESHHFIRRENDQAQGGHAAVFLREREDWHKPMVLDETFSGIVRGRPERYAINRAEAWETLIGGGAGYNNLDWSFTPADPLGCGAAPLDDGRRLDGRALRQWLGILSQTLEEHDIANLRPAYELVGELTPGYASAASETLARFVVYVVDQRVYQAEPCPEASVTLLLNLPVGQYGVQAMDPRTGERVKVADVVSDGSVSIKTPPFSEDLVLLIAQTGA